MSDKNHLILLLITSKRCSNGGKRVDIAFSSESHENSGWFAPHLLQLLLPSLYDFWFLTIFTYFCHFF
uniref:Putative ovule protein n=1 Tax=Solanum chacoense TaxID=4108 RepID=A0A0V0GLQ8_SOLCH